MAIDVRYQDNIVLKQDAFQNLLTNIKNYPIIDIDYISETDTDQLHGTTIWDHYTEGVPCIKITYGDERTTKGNIMFAEQYKNEIAAKQNTLKHLQTILDELTKRKSRWEAVYEENHAIYQEKDNQVQRFIANFEEIKSNKLAFLMAGWNLLYINLPINIDDPYEVVPADAANINQYNPNVIYYTHSKEYMFKRYEFENEPNQFVDVYTSIRPDNSSYDTMRADWAEKVANQEIYIKKSTPVSPDALLLQQELGPQLFSYENILIKKNPYILIQRGSAYDSNATYYVHNSSNGEFSTYINNHVSSSDSSYTQKIEDWNQKVLAKVIYIKTTEDDPQRVFNLTYTSLGNAKADVLSVLQWAKNQVDGQGNSIWKTNPDEQEVFDNFIEFIMAYNKLVFLDTIGIAGYSANDIEDLKRENPDLVTMVQRLTREDESSDFDWEAAEEYWNANLLSYYNTFYQRIDGIVNTIKNVINKNLIYIRDQIRDANASIVEYTELVNVAQRDLDALWERINSEAVYEYVPVPEGAVYNRAREYFTYNSNTGEYVPYTYTTATSWANGVTKYVKNDRTVYGYKYVRVGSNIEFSDTYITNTEPYTVSTSELEKYDTADNQKSGTFRITINKHIYEVPVKGFGDTISNKDINIMTSQQSNQDPIPNVNFDTYVIKLTNTHDINIDHKNQGTDCYKSFFFPDTSTTQGILGATMDHWSDLRVNEIGGDYVEISTEKHQYSPKKTYYIKDNNNEYQIYTGGASGWSNNTTLYIDDWVRNAYIANLNIRDKLISTANNVKINENGEIIAKGDIFSRNVDVEKQRLIGVDSKAGQLALFADAAANGNRGLYVSKHGTASNGYSLITIDTNGKSDLNITNDIVAGHSITAKNSIEANYEIFSKYVENVTIGENKIGVDGAAGKMYLYSQVLTDNDHNRRGLYVAHETNGHSVISIDKDGKSSIYVKNELKADGKLIINNTVNNSANNDNAPDSSASIYTAGGGYFSKNLRGNKVFNAVFNDYAEYRTTIDLEPGRVVVDNDDGSLRCADKRLMPGAQIISDTFGTCMGETDTAKTPLAVAGRVLVYTYQDRYNYHAGMAVCSATNGTVDIMTREEIRDYPDCIVGIVSEIPEYEEWGTDKVKVNGRIWIKIK